MSVKRKVEPRRPTRIPLALYPTVKMEQPCRAPRQTVGSWLFLQWVSVG